jgi:hypothetical protein
MIPLELSLVTLLALDAAGCVGRGPLGKLVIRNSQMKAVLVARILDFSAQET